jgi:hypothetical protein
MTTSAVLFLTAWGMILAAAFSIFFRILPNEKWQFIASIPVAKNKNGIFESINLTWYGFFTSSSIVYSVLIFTVLALSGGAEIQQITVFVVAILAVAVPSAKIIAAMVEKRSGTITIGGAAFAAIIVAPFITMLLPYFGDGRPVSGLMLSSISTAYAAGEGFGRLACLSFGCCYGKRMDSCNRIAQMLFSKFNFRFYGGLKKASYEDCLEGVRLLPVQGITAVLLSVTAIASASLIFSGHYKAAFLFSVCVTFGWRLLSEFLRADFRGASKISAYQIMSLTAIIYSIAVSSVVWFGGSGSTYMSMVVPVMTDIRFILTMQMLWLLGFIYTGISSVTKSRIEFISDRRTSCR